jgi:predicted GIY-YIG superfamily endonuclease
MIFWEQHATMELAMKRERQIKRWSRAKKLAPAQGRVADLHELARPRK